MPKDNFLDWNKDQLIEEIKKLKKRKTYGLVWEPATEQVVELCKEKLPVLTEVKDKEISTGENKPVNILIEGDNYHALSVLNYTHKNKIDIIYIDPPYNTGNGESFRYNDTIVDSEDSFRHSKWLSFMKKRLDLSKYLLNEKGIILISIDDNEYAQLKLLCDEVFGEKNFIGPFIWKSKIGGGNDNKYLANEHEYIITYAKNIQKLPPLFEKQTEEYKSKFKLKDKHFQKRGGYYLDSLYKSGIDSNRPNLRYPIKAPDGTKILPPTIWRLSKGEFERRLNNDEIVFKKDRSDNWKIMTKTYFILEGEERGKRPRSILPIFGGTRAGNQQIQDIFGEDVFKYPKNTDLMKYIICLSPKGKNSTVLDFFAGTGTTCQAVLELNEEDNGNRTAIICTNNENNICTEVTYPRIKNVIM
jgi:adenine-specific DNA-methyltransferase